MKPLNSLVVCKGLPASGKSTKAKELVEYGKGIFKRINFDLMREMLDFGKHSQENEDLIHGLTEVMSKYLIEKGKTVILDNTNLSDRQMNLCNKIAKDNNTDFDTCDFTDVPLNVCIERDATRGDKSVGRKVIKDMWNKYLQKPYVGVPYNSDLPDCFIVDIDGTVAERNGRGPFELDKVHTDSVRKHVKGLILGSYYDSYPNLHVIFLSGREGTSVCEALTEKWLADNFYELNAFHLLMRKEGDNRDDTIVKREIYEEHIKDKYNVVAVFDDRAKVCRMWKEVGLGDRLFRVGLIDEDEF